MVEKCFVLLLRCQTQEEKTIWHPRSKERQGHRLHVSEDVHILNPTNSSNATVYVCVCMCVCVCVCETCEKVKLSHVMILCFRESTEVEPAVSINI